MALIEVKDPDWSTSIGIILKGKWSSLIASGLNREPARLFSGTIDCTLVFGEVLAATFLGVIERLFEVVATGGKLEDFEPLP